METKEIIINIDKKEAEIFLFCLKHDLENSITCHYKNIQNSTNNYKRDIFFEQEYLKLETLKKLNGLFPQFIDLYNEILSFLDTIIPKEDSA